MTLALCEWENPPSIEYELSVITWNFWPMYTALWACGCVLWEKGSYLTGTNILVSARDLAREQRKSFPHGESSWRVLELVFLGHAHEHPPPFLTSPHLCGLTQWTTTSFLYSVPCWFLGYHALWCVSYLLFQTLSLFHPLKCWCSPGFLLLISFLILWSLCGISHPLP